MTLFQKKDTTVGMELGIFSISLAVKNIAESRAFYEKLGFVVTGGNQEQNWLILRNGSTVIGLFQGMFEKNMLTFTPGIDLEFNTLEQFTDVREIRTHLESQGISVEGNTQERSNGPAHITLTDPDGNPILIDQHV